MSASLRNVQMLGVDGAPFPSDPIWPERVQTTVRRILDETPLAAWATVAPGGAAHVNIGYFAHDPEELTLYLLSHPGSLHCRNIAANPTMAVAVFRSAQNWIDPGRGVQLFGTGRELDGAEASDAARIYGRRYQAYGAWRAELRTGDPAGAYRFYRFAPDRLKLLDEAEFGDAVFVTAEIVRTD